MVSVLLLISCSDNKQNILKSPDGRFVVQFMVRNGRIFYSVENDDIVLIEASPMGLTTASQDFTHGLAFVESSETRTITKNYQLKNGKKSDVRYIGNEKEFTVTNNTGAKMTVIFRAANDGIAFRYRLYGDGRETVLSELSGFRLPAESKAFVTPLSEAKSGWARTNPSYEEFYHLGVSLETISDYGQGWTYPALFEIDEDHWVMLSETGTDRNYVATHLSDITDGIYYVEFPHDDHNLPEDPTYAEVNLPFDTPWRTITAGSLPIVVESTMAFDLVEPLYEARYDYKTGRSMWS